MKLKLNTKMAMPPPALPGEVSGSQTPTQTPGKISIKLSTPVSQTPPAPTPKGSKKRKSAAGEEGPATVKKQKSKATATTAKPNMLRLKSAKPPDTPKTAATSLSFNYKGKPPQRSAGVGYDSEAEDAEEDPSLEENIILRMKPGPDCDLLRRAIDNRLIGADKKDGGIGVSFRFFHKDGRRAAITIQNNVYGAVLVDLPCIIESMKSWDKKGWWKSADICQMLLVLDQIPDQEAAKTMKLPPYVNEKTYQWPHGLTPPLHNVRKRRFRQRVNHRTIEAAENEVDRLTSEDARVEALGGTTSFEILDVDELNAENEQDGEGDEEEETQLMQEEPDFDDVDNDAIAEQMAMELGEGFDDDDEDDQANAALTVENGGLVSSPNVQPDSTVPPTPVPATEDAPSPAINGTDSGDAQDADEDEDDEESGEDFDDDEDEEERERAEGQQQALEDCEDLRTKIIHAREQLAAAKNPILQDRYANRINELKAELALKLPAAGLDPDEAENA